MSDSNYVQASFTGGEWSPFAQGRIDKPEYRTAMNVCRNGYPVEEGAWLRRSGSRYGWTTLNGKAGRVIHFDFKQSAPYILEFTDGALRMGAAAIQAGGLTTPMPLDIGLVTTNDNQVVVSVSTANPAVVQTAGAHGWATGNQVFFLFALSISGAFMPALKNRVFTVTVVDATHFSLNGLDGASLVWSTQYAGTVVAARVLNILSPYVNGDWEQIRRVQAETQAILLHGSYAPRSLLVTALPTTTTFATFSLATATFIDGPYLDPPTDASTLTPSGLSGSISLTASSIASINGGLGFQAGDVGRQVRLLSQPATWLIGTAYNAGDKVTYSGAYFICTTANTGQQPDVAIAYWAIDTTAATWAWAIITAINSALVVTATIQTQNGANLLYTNPITVWRLGVYSTTTGWPTCGVYYEGRLWIAGSIPNRVDSSMVNMIANGVIVMSPTALDGTVADNNGISYTFNSDDTNPIFWMKGATVGIVCGTQSGEWLIQASQLSDPLTPTSIQAHRGTTYGSEPIEPENCQSTIAFVQRYGRSLLEYFPDTFSGKYIAPNLSQYAKHLTSSGMAEIKYQAELLPVIWARCNDETLIGATYERDSLISSRGPEFCGWHRHDLGSGRTMQSIAVGPSSDGEVDALAMVTNDPMTNTRHVEIMQTLFDVNDTILDGWFVDDASVPQGGQITAGSGQNTLTLYGFTYLNGKTVAVVVGGIDCGDVVVSGGAVSVPIDYDVAALLTSDYLASISSQTDYGTMTCRIDGLTAVYYVPAVVGFSFTSQGQVLRPDTSDQGRSPTGPNMGKPRRNQQIGVLMHNTQGISFGTSFAAGKLNAAQLKSPGGTVALTALQLFSGIYWNTVADDWSLDGMLGWQISRPYPAAVVALTGFMNSTDR